MKFKKKGLILQANGQREWMQTHIQNPFLVKMNDRNRIFFTTRGAAENGLYKANIGWIDVEKDNIINVLSIADKPVFDYGKRGTFDEFGMMPGAIVSNRDDLWMYYVGWTRCVSVPYSWEIGLAISNDGGLSFRRYGDGPVLGKSYDDPYLQNGCSSVIQYDGQWHMFYSSGIGWLSGKDGHMESQYILRRAISEDGIKWTRKEYLLPLKYEDESQTSPTIFFHKNKWHMLFPYRHSLDFRNADRGYRIGYAVSDDLIKWERIDEQCEIDVSADSLWDNEMICYPHVTKVGDELVMLYCGNGFGVGGLGYAIIGD